MNFRKISLEEMEVCKKYRINIRNYYVSVQFEEFTFGSHAVFLNENIGEVIGSGAFGISKQEHRVSRRHFVNSMLGKVYGG